MHVKFVAATMAKYSGIDGLGNEISLSKDEVVEVSESIGKILLQKYKNDFVKEEKKVEARQPEQELAKHAPKTNKKYEGNKSLGLK